MLSQLMENFREIIFHVEKISKERRLKFRVIVDENEENTWFLKSMNYRKIRKPDNIIENFQISVTSIYVEPLFDKVKNRLAEYYGETQSLW
ncbi:MAG TPA: hypothetical protein VJR94_00535 [Candidatus Nitrosocosmicus sp.]|nr:hypothetical protein [Candidatus Nitrosocosmicus sp.]